MGLFDAVGGIISSGINYFATDRTNKTNQKIADENLAYQKANDEYLRGLQDKIFEREDTAILRQADQLSQLGINPLSQQMNGSGAAAGAAIQTTAPQNNFQAIAPQVQFGQLGSLMDLIKGFDEVESNGVQRDAVNAQTNINKLIAQEKEIQNLILADKNNIGFDEDGNPYLKSSFKEKEQDFNSSRYKNENASAERNERENQFQKSMNLSDNTPQTIRTPAEIANQIKTAAAADKDSKNSLDYLSKPLQSGKNALESSAGAVARTFAGAAEDVAGVSQKIAGTAKKAGSKVGNYFKKGYNKTKQWVSDKYNQYKDYVSNY